MAKFSTQEILEAAALFRTVPNNIRGLITGLMMGVHIMHDKETMPDMVKLALAMKE